MRTILVVDDSKMHRDMLKDFIEGEYEVLEAENGKQAITLLCKNFKIISAVVLDLVMPIMDGFEVLKEMQNLAIFSQIPVIVATSNVDVETEERAVLLGATSFTLKPYNKSILMNSLHNCIRLREMSAITNVLLRDHLTGVLSRTAFFTSAEKLLEKAKPGQYAISCMDIPNFKAQNEMYGTEEGDKVLQYIGKKLNQVSDSVDGICGRISDDNFVLLYPFNSSTQKLVDRAREEILIPEDKKEQLVVKEGRYLLNDLSITIGTMYDRAMIAKKSVKKTYDCNFAYFDVDMLENEIQDKFITKAMKEALKEKQFEIWLQPQVDYETSMVTGAEALVRWNHPERGYIYPNVFIPIFEQNGFIYQMDQFVWEEACICLRRWMDEGKEPVPISVNISRYDILKNDLLENIDSLLDKYSIPAGILNFEITESVFTDNTGKIGEVVEEMKKRGLKIEIDDFGSGYSSLNALKDISADILKLDMRFLDQDVLTDRAKIVIESIVAMIHKLGKGIVAEGIEKKEQADYLASIGCNCIQGYYYAKPMKINKFEEYIK